MVWRREYDRNLKRKNLNINKNDIRKAFTVFNPIAVIPKPKSKTFNAREYARVYMTKPRIELIKALGNACTKCGFNDIRALQIDFISGGHMKTLRRKFSNDSVKMWRFYLKDIELARTQLQVLCANHNWIKRVENHETRPIKISIPQ